MIVTKLPGLIQCVIFAHTFCAKAVDKRFRKWDGKTPYYVHPLWCAMTLLTEEKLSEEIRRVGSQALLLHDMLEDTTAPLPEDTEAEVRRLVMDMTFDSSDEEVEKIWQKSGEVKLFKLYDKVSNFLDAGWMDSGRVEKYFDYTSRLLNFVAGSYGELNIVLIGREIIKKRR
ncbi:MAG: hypothetical protein KKE50_07360 [Nanoarchaeota archaeon]|nr:hypothetical protein [Nanoarchaeota archaeon]